MGIINGTPGNDFGLIGSPVADIINGFAGDDVMFGLAGGDQLIGGSGDDQLNGDIGNDLLDGGLGSDTADYFGSAAGVTVNLGLAGAQNTGGGGIDTLVSIENLQGTTFNDTLSGNGANNVLWGLGGSDTLLGFAGNDRLVSSLDNDSIFGVSKDLLDGGLGSDTADYVGAAAGVTVNLGLVGAQNTGGGGIDTLVSIENLQGTIFNDRLVGNAVSNTMNGGAGVDTLIGGRGADSLNGGLGKDIFDYNAVGESPAGTGRDKIVGFAGAGAALGDRIDLATIDANTLLSGNQIFIWGGSFIAGHLRYVGGVLQGNIDADAAAEFEIQLVGAPASSVGGPGTDIVL